MGAHCLPHPPRSLNSTTIQPWDPSLPSLQRCDTSQGNHGMRGIEPEYVSIFIVFIQLFELKNIGELQCIGCLIVFFLIHSNLIHSLLFSCSVMSNSLWPCGLQHTRLLCPSPSPRVCSNSCPLSWWRHPTISSSVVPFSCLQSFPATGSFLMSWLFTSKFWSFSISPSNEYSGLISFRIDWFDLLPVQGALKSPLQHHNSKASIFWHSAFFMVQLSHPHMTIGKTIALTMWTFVRKVMSLLFSMLSRFVIAFLPRSKSLLISWLHHHPKSCSDFGAQENKVCHDFHCFPIYVPWSDGTRCHDLSFLNGEF